MRAWLCFLALACGALNVSTADAQTTLYRCTDGDGNLTIQSAPCPKGTQERTQVVDDLPSAPPAPTPAAARDLPEPEWQLQSTPAPAAALPDMPPAVVPVTPAEPLIPEPGQPIIREKPLEVSSDGIGPGATGRDDFQLLDSGTPQAERDPVTDRPEGQSRNAEDEGGTPRVPPPTLYACRTWDNDTYYGELAEPPPRCAPLEVTGLGGVAGIGAGRACEMRDDVCQPVAEDRLCDAWRYRLRDQQAQLVFARTDDPAGTRATIERIEAMLAQSTCARR